jgi:hypothetical protein
MLTFKQFFTEAVTELPDLLKFAREFFNRRLDPINLRIYGDFLEDRGHTEQAEFFHSLSEWNDPKKKRGKWRGHLVRLFYDIFSYRPHTDFILNDNLANSWYFHPYGPSPGVNNPWSDRYPSYYNHVVYPGETSYRLSLTTGQWFFHTNKQDERVRVISTRDISPGYQWGPRQTITLRDYQPIDVDQVPDELIYFAIYKILEKQARGSH